MQPAVAYGNTIAILMHIIPKRKTKHNL